MGIEVLGPHLNESGVYFEVNTEGQIRFGLGAIKGAGDAAVEAMIKERDAHGPFKDIFNFAKRMSQRSVNKKTFECLALSGAFDCFPEFHRKQYIAGKDGDISLTEIAIRYSAKLQQEELSAQTSLFGGGATGTEMPLPKVDPVEPFSEIEKLHFEKEVVGVYISGHPLDNFKFEIETFCNLPINDLNNLEGKEGKDVKVGGIVSSVEHKFTKTGKPFGKMIVEDYSGKFEFLMWSEDYMKFKSFLMPGIFLFVEGSVQRKTWGDLQLEFKIRSMDLLNDIGTKRTKGLQLKFPAKSINKELIEEIESICNDFNGNTPLYVSLKDEEESITLEMLSRKIRIKPTNDLVKRMKKIPEVVVEVV
jgi:DNA polymerase-3 subunit alpha